MRNFARILRRKPCCELFLRRFASSVHSGHPELTLALIKPHAVAQPWILEDIDDLLARESFTVVLNKEIYLTYRDAQQFYKEHEGKFFYQRACELMSSGPIVAKLLARVNAIQHWRSLLGPTKVFRCVYSHPDSIRGLYGLTDTRNVAHGSDSTDSTAREAAFFFPEFDIAGWYASEASRRS